MQTIIVFHRDADGEVVAAEFFDDPYDVEHKGSWLTFSYLTKIIPQPHEIFAHTGARVWHGIWDRGLLDCMSRRLAGYVLRPYWGKAPGLFRKRIMNVVD